MRANAMKLKMLMAALAATLTAALAGVTAAGAGTMYDGQQARQPALPAAPGGDDLYALATPRAMPVADRGGPTSEAVSLAPLAGSGEYQPIHRDAASLFAVATTTATDRPEHYALVPLPAAAWSGLVAMLVLGVAAAVRKQLRAVGRVA